MALYRATDGENWNDDGNWLSEKTLGEWHGVTTDGSGRVTALDLQGNGLSGVLPTEVGNLSQLQILHLEENLLTGQLPAEIGQLSNLRELWLHTNRFNGPAPDAEWATSKTLEVLEAWGNQLSGELPASMGNLSKLRVLSLGGNEFSGPIPSEFGGSPAWNTSTWRATC